MRTMIITTLCAVTVALSGCKLLSGYRMDQQQGNVFTEAQVHELHRGMTKQEVRYVMGNPVLERTFDDNRWDYVYTYQHGKSPLEKKKVSLIFKNNRVTQIVKELHDANLDHHDGADHHDAPHEA